MWVCMWVGVREGGLEGRFRLIICIVDFLIIFFLKFLSSSSSSSSSSFF